jgi:L-threonylcarbamoyladenylate synthase
VADARDICEYAEITQTAERIIGEFLPAPLTLVLKKKNSALDACCSLDTVAIRVPKNKAARKLIGLSGAPVAAPSANLSGKPSHTDPEYIIRDFDGMVDMIVCGENCEIGLESTVISFNADGSLNILRSGHITREMLSGYKICESAPELRGAPRSPGMKYTHYSPDAPLYLLLGSEAEITEFVKKEMRRKKAGFLCFDEFLGHFGENENIAAIGARGDLAAQAKNLFGALNRLDALGLDAIYSIMPERTGIGEAVYSRLAKASGGKVINV